MCPTLQRYTIIYHFQNGNSHSFGLQLYTKNSGAIIRNKNTFLAMAVIRPYGRDFRHFIRLSRQKIRSEATGPAGPQGGFCRQPLSRGEGFGVRVTESRLVLTKKSRTNVRPFCFVRTRRFELRTSCLSSKRSKPTELCPQKDCKDR